MTFFFNDTATTEIYTLSLHDALPIWSRAAWPEARRRPARWRAQGRDAARSEEHTSELQSRQYLVCRLLLEKTNSLPSHDPAIVCLPPTSLIEDLSLVHHVLLVSLFDF